MRRSDVRAIAGLAVLALLVLNANGREIGNYDSQPTKFAAIELAARGTLTLDRVVDRYPSLAERPGFAVSVDGRRRSAYSVLPSVLAAGPARVLAAVGLIDLDSPLAPALVAKLTASLLATAAMVCAFLAARSRASTAGALLVSLAYGLGTNVAMAGQTLGGHETVAAGLSLAVWTWMSTVGGAGAWQAWAGAAGLAAAGATRPQVCPLIVVLVLSILCRRSERRRAWALVVLPVAAGLVLVTNLQWFGHPLGALPRLEAIHPSVHATIGTFASPWVGAAGLLVSPSRGLLVFSPVVLVCLAGVGRAVREGWRGPLAWCLTAAAVQFVVYASYTVWWGGHAYGPRYLVDVLPALVPVAAAGLAGIVRGRLTRAMAVLVLVWSMGLAMTGLWCYPAERWNTAPEDVDRAHRRLWDWRDPQFVRCWRTGPSPQNLALFR